MSKKRSALFESIFPEGLGGAFSEGVRLNTQLWKSGSKMIGSLVEESRKGGQGPMNIVGKLARVNGTVYRSYVRHSQAALQEIIDTVDSVAGSAGSKQEADREAPTTGEAPPSGLELKGAKGSTVQGAFIVANPSDTTRRVQCALSEFHGQADETVPSDCVTLTPPVFELGAGEEARITVSCKIINAFRSGRTYTAFLDLPGISRQQLKLVLHVMRARRTKKRSGSGK